MTRDKGTQSPTNGLQPWMVGARFRPESTDGLYESYYLRANHPRRDLALWIRYTVFVPKGRPQQAIGELWSVFFDGETSEHVVAKEEHSISAVHLAPTTLHARIAHAELTAHRATGHADGPDARIGWDLRIGGDPGPEREPMFLLERASYDRSFPSAKSLVLRPFAVLDGTLDVAGRVVDVDGWVGSLNHNWGSRHTDAYAFGQVAGFDDSPQTFLEIVSARVKVGPARLPMVTCLSLRHDGRTHALVNPVKQLKANADYGYFRWNFETGNDAVLLRGKIAAEPGDFVGLNYYNPPGGIKHCLNTKIGSCRLEITDRGTGHTEVVNTNRRALFEILTDHRGHGVSIRA